MLPPCGAVFDLNQPDAGFYFRVGERVESTLPA
jgi:hypothetical protein